MFRPGSVSKLFTWTAVMQLVEQGKLDLDRDVNEYLDFKISATFPQPITLRNIMTHTPGFEDTYKDVFLEDEKDMRPTGEYVKGHLPRRMYPPGTTIAYSNYGATLAGYIVERVSGIRYEDYIDKFILQPLEMAHASFYQPLPAALAPFISNDYTLATMRPGHFEMVQTVPAGALSAAAGDMAHFMIAHLQDGQFGDTRILKPETARLMHSRQFAAGDAVNGMCFGFYEESRNGHRIIGHAGNVSHYGSDLHLVPDAGLGFFISYNSWGRFNVDDRAELWDMFLDRYFPYHAPELPTLPTAAADAHGLTGKYIVSRRSDASLIRPELINSEESVSATADGTLLVDSDKDFNGDVKRWHEIAPMVFQVIGGQQHLQFARNASGRMVMANDFPVFVYERASIAEDKAVNQFVLGAVPAVLLLAFFSWPVGAFLRRHYRAPLGWGRDELRLRAAARLACLLNAVALGVWVYTLQFGSSQTKYDGVRHGAQALIVLSIFGTLIVLYHCYRACVSPSRWILSKIAELVVIVSCAGWLWLIANWNMLDFSLHY